MNADKSSKRETDDDLQTRLGGHGREVFQCLIPLAAPALLISSTEKSPFSRHDPSPRPMNQAG
jgi:hypothetical protein